MCFRFTDVEYEAEAPRPSGRSHSHYHWDGHNWVVQQQVGAVFTCFDPLLPIKVLGSPENI